MEHLPAVQSQIQVVLLAVALVLMAAVLSILGMLWRLRGPVNAIIAAYVASDSGKLAIAAGLREYLVRPEGTVFMEGVINGKVRREIAEHNRDGAAHYDKFGQFAKREEMNGAVSSVRELCTNENLASLTAREAITSELRSIGAAIDRAQQRSERSERRES